MRELIRHILKESSSKIRLLDVIEDEGIFVAAEMVGGLNKGQYSQVVIIQGIFEKPL